MAAQNGGGLEGLGAHVGFAAAAQAALRDKLGQGGGTASALGVPALAPLELLRAEHVKTLLALEETSQENHRLREKIRVLEAQIVPAEANMSETVVKLIAPSCAEYHQMERETNEKLKTESRQLQSQLKRAVHTVSLLEQQLVAAGQQIRRAEVEKDMSMAECKDQLTRSHRAEVSLLQEQIAEMERRFGAERKRLLEERDQLALRLDSFSSLSSQHNGRGGAGGGPGGALQSPRGPEASQGAQGLQTAQAIGEQVTVESLRKLVMQLAEENSQLRGVVSRVGHEGEQQQAQQSPQQAGAPPLKAASMIMALPRRADAAASASAATSASRKTLAPVPGAAASPRAQGPAGAEQRPPSGMRTSSTRN
eukprot:m51a1_g255 hypothetical protein (366) ;mRNA; r:201174-202481